MTSRDLTLVVVAASEENLKRFELSNCHGLFTLVQIINSERAPLSSLGNLILQRSVTETFGLCHADVFFGPGALDAFSQCAGEGNVCGVVGMNPDLKEDSPGRNPGATKETQRWGEVWADKNPGPVSTLDSASVFFRRDSGLRFDSVNFDGMHLHVEDLCLQAQQRGIPVVVPAANATHYSNPELNNWEDWWHKDYRRYFERFQAKWEGVKYGVT